MTKDAKIDQSALKTQHNTRSQAHPPFLFVGDPVNLCRANLQLPVPLQMDHCHIYDLAHHLKDRPDPDIVLSFAITPLFDCLELAQYIWTKGFRGRQRILGANLPAPGMICAEVRMSCPGLDFAVFDPSELRRI